MHCLTRGELTKRARSEPDLVALLYATKSDPNQTSLPCSMLPRMHSWELELCVLKSCALSRESVAKLSATIL
eukprot:33078-Heterocapsa_arctica.AAC.1